MKGRRLRQKRRSREPAQSGGGKGWLKRIPRWIEISAATIVLIGGVIAGSKFLVGSGEDLLAQGDAGDLRVSQVVVTNGRLATDLTNGQFVQTAASTPQLDITVLNTGKHPVLLTGARVTVVDSARLTVCDYHTGDAVAVSRDYTVELPVLPLRSERVTSHPLHQEIGPGEVDRFKVLFRVPWSGEDNYVYALRVALVAYGGESVGLGRFVLGVPEAVNRGGRILPEGPEPFVTLNRQERVMSTWCARRNLADLGRVLGRPGKRSPALAALADFRPASWWAGFADHRSPRAAAELLLTNGPALAVFAAEQTGDPAFEARIRRRAATQMLRQAEHALRLGYPWAAWGAVLAARYAIRFSPSAESKAVLAQAEAAWEAGQAEISTGSGE